MCLWKLRSTFNGDEKICPYFMIKSSKCYFVHLYHPFSIHTFFFTHEKCKKTSISDRGMGNFCGDGNVSEEETSPEPETFRRINRGREVNERYPGVHYYEENRLQDAVFRGKRPDTSEPKCSCYGPTPDERFFIQRCPHPQVLNTTISKDLAEITEESKSKAQELRQERIHLIKSKVKEITGKDVDLDAGSLDTEAEDLAADEQVAKLFEAEKLDGKNPNFLTANSAVPPAPTPVPVSDLAPMPTNEEIFGKIDELRKKHAVEMADFEKAQTINKARTTQGLQEKLQARRSRRSRMQNHEREIEALQTA
ncbi:uncharacterized protein TNIN_369181 [Trichonephila inaurata madagascariensis]|uniref:Uncharacterized protein n=1 Tax=Trichonephila inaurata madagascariensis TaxID=2747483 RepID=A0A8X7CBF9_9ARAC|nr:uncharacterized protein TNIN_369181 [Trichonephila inaurata madagascariensis]